MDFNTILKQKSTWAGLGVALTAALPLFGVSSETVAAIATVLGGLAVIFLRQGIQKSQDKNVKNPS